MPYRFSAVDIHRKMKGIGTFQYLNKIGIIKIIAISSGTQFTDTGETQFGTAFDFSDCFISKFRIDRSKTAQTVWMTFHHIGHVIVMHGHKTFIIPVPALHNQAVDTGFLSTVQSFFGIGPRLFCAFAVFRLFCQKCEPVVTCCVFFPVFINFRREKMDMTVPDLCFFQIHYPLSVPFILRRPFHLEDWQ